MQEQKLHAQAEELLLIQTSFERVTRALTAAPDARVQAASLSGTRMEVLAAPTDAEGRRSDTEAAFTSPQYTAGHELATSELFRELAHSMSRRSSPLAHGAEGEAAHPRDDSPLTATLGALLSPGQTTDSQPSQPGEGERATGSDSLKPDPAFVEACVLRLLQQKADAKFEAQEARVRCSVLMGEITTARERCQEAVARVDAMSSEHIQMTESLAAAQSAVALLQGEVDTLRAQVAPSGVDEVSAPGQLAVIAEAGAIPAAGSVPQVESETLPEEPEVSGDASPELDLAAKYQLLLEDWNALSSRLGDPQPETQEVSQVRSLLCITRVLPRIAAIVRTCTVVHSKSP